MASSSSAISVSLKNKVQFYVQNSFSVLLHMYDKSRSACNCLFTAVKDNISTTHEYVNSVSEKSIYTISKNVINIDPIVHC